MNVLLLVAMIVGALVVIGFVLRALWFLIKVAVLIGAVVFLAHLLGLT